MRSHTPEQPLDLSLRFQELKHAIRGDDEIEAAAQGKVGDVAEYCPGFSRKYPCGLQLLEAACEHSRGPLQPSDRAAGGREREEHPARPAPQFQHRGVCRWQTCRIEGEIVRDRWIDIIVLRRRSAYIVLHMCLCPPLITGPGVPPTSGLDHGRLRCSSCLRTPPQGAACVGRTGASGGLDASQCGMRTRAVDSRGRTTT